MIRISKKDPTGRMVTITCQVIGLVRNSKDLNPGWLTPDTAYSTEMPWTSCQLILPCSDREGKVQL